jgi:hypothetical protein
LPLVFTCDNINDNPHDYNHDMTPRTHAATSSFVKESRRDLLELTLWIGLQVEQLLLML